MVELKVAEIRVAGAETPPVVVLVEVDGERRLPIWMTHGGAAAILGATEESDQRRPSIHDLTGVLITDLVGASLDAVRITGCDEGQFYAELAFGDQSLPARPSDAIALALRVGCPIECAPEVMDEYGVTADAEPTEGDILPPDEVERFLEFLDSVVPEDFDDGEEQP